jgi:outer membrane protein OmpA-like peptidoglycan-associated protein
MKTRTFFALLLSTSLAAPALAQQSGSASQSQSSSQSSSSAPDREPLRPVTSSDFWDGEQPNLGNLLAHPLTTKKYVQKQVAPIRDRINELDDIAATNTRMSKDVDDRTQRGLQLVSNKTTEADQHAIDAGTRATGAQQAAQAASTHLTVVEQKVASVGQYKPGSETEIRFSAGQTVLSKKAKDALDEMATPLKDQNGYVIEIRGFAAGRGQAAIANSRKMADAVMRYLVESQNIPVHRIYVLGMGDAPAESGAKKPSSGGKVEVSLLKNELVSSNQN